MGGVPGGAGSGCGFVIVSSARSSLSLDVASGLLPRLPDHRRATHPRAAPEWADRSQAVTACGLRR
ncbi:hypothetical protein GPN2_20781 [Streptomyces murinus]